MTVKETILLAAELLGCGERVKEYFEEKGETGKKEAQTLLRCFNLVENEMALDYLPLYAEDETQSDTGAIAYSAFGKAVVRVLCVRDEWGNKIPFRLFPDHLKTAPGKVRVAYTYTPEEKGEEDSSDFVLQASPRLFALGIAAEYCLAAGLYEEAEIWDAKYRDALKAAYAAKPARVLRSRRWA